MSKFYRTIFTVEVLSEEPVDFDNPQDICDAITSGDCSGKMEIPLQEEVDGSTMANLLKEQGTDPEFFGLDEDGNSAEV